MKTRWGKRLAAIAMALTLCASAQAACAQTLRIANMGDEMYDEAFQAANPGAQVEHVHSESFGLQGIIHDVLSRDSRIDLYELSTGYLFSELKKGGYVEDLTPYAGIAEGISRFDPKVQAVLRSGEALLAVPYEVYVRNWAVNRPLWDEYGLGELPETYLELIEQCIAWNEEYADEEVCLFSQQNMPVELMNSVMDVYIAEFEGTGDALDFDTPAFRDTMDALLRLRPYAQEDAYKEAILTNYAWRFGERDNPALRMVLPPRVHPQGKSVVQVNARVLVVNPQSENKELAAAYLRTVLQEMPLEMAAQLTADAGEGIEWPWYERSQAELAEEIGELEALLSTAAEDKREEIERELESLRAQAADEEQRWQVTAQERRDYSELFAYASFGEGGAIGNGDIETLESLYGLGAQFLDGRMTSGELVRALNQRVRMIYDERID